MRSRENSGLKLALGITIPEKRSQKRWKVLRGKVADKKSKKQHVASNGGTGGAYFLGMIGAAWYYVSVADGFGEVIVALLKALVWPGFLVYELLKFVAA